MKRIFLMISLIGLRINFSMGQTHLMEIMGQVISNSKPLAGVKIKASNDDIPIELIISSDSGNFSFHFDYDSVYTLKFSKQGFITKSIKIDTHVPKKEQSKIQSLRFKMVLAVEDSINATKTPEVGTIFIDESYNYYLGFNKFGHNEFEDAINYFNLSIKAKYKLADSYTKRGICFSKIGNNSSACNDWFKAKELGDKESEKLLVKYCKSEIDSIH